MTELQIHHIKIATQGDEDPCDEHVVASGQNHAELLKSFVAHVNNLESIDETRFYDVVEVV